MISSVLVKMLSERSVTRSAKLFFSLCIMYVNLFEGTTDGQCPVQNSADQISNVVAVVCRLGCKSVSCKVMGVNMFAGKLKRHHRTQHMSDMSVV